jgi:hypothetical protein
MKIFDTCNFLHLNAAKTAFLKSTSLGKRGKSFFFLKRKIKKSACLKGKKMRKLCIYFIYFVFTIWASFDGRYGRSFKDLKIF